MFSTCSFDSVGFFFLSQANPVFQQQTDKSISLEDMDINKAVELNVFADITSSKEKKQTEESAAAVQLQPTL